MSPEHRMPDGSRQVGPTWESLIERQIREAMDEGSFDELPHAGGRLPLEDDNAAGEWALAHRMLRNAGVAPPWIEADKDARASLVRRDALLERAGRIGPGGRVRARAELASIVADANAAIGRLNAEAPTAAQHRRVLVPEEELARLERAFPPGPRVGLDRRGQCGRRV
jgi:hypothetical protein